MLNKCNTSKVNYPMHVMLMPETFLKHVDAVIATACKKSVGLEMEIRTKDEIAFPHANQGTPVLTALAEVNEMAPPACDVCNHTDSMYVINGAKRWASMRRWRRW